MKNDFSAHAAMAARADAVALERARWAAVLARPAKPRPARRAPARGILARIFAR